MKTIFRTVLVGALCFVVFTIRAQADDVTVSLDPTDGAVTGPAGSTVGWGFTLTDTGSDFLVVTGSDFCVGMVTSPCSNSFGTYTDFIGQEFLVVGPAPESSSASQSFDDTAMTGVGSFTINTTSLGTLDGFIAITYDLYSVDPNSADFDPIVDTVSNGNYLYAPASVTVGSSSTNVPEPGTMSLLAIGLLALLLMMGFRSSRREIMSA